MEILGISIRNERSSKTVFVFISTMIYAISIMRELSKLWNSETEHKSPEIARGKPVVSVS